MSDLLSCPFCGSWDVHISTIPAWGFDSRSIWYVRCDSCHCKGSMAYYEHEAVKAWNTRAERTCIPKDPNDELPGTDCPAWECSVCGELFEQGAKFCSQCGAKVLEA